MTYKIIKATTKDEKQIQAFLQEHFYPDEPMSESVRFNGCDKETPLILKQNLSLIAVLKSNPEVICGVLMNREVLKETYKNYYNPMLAQLNDDDPYKKILTFYQIYQNELLEKVEKECWVKTNTNKALELTFLSVRKEDRRNNTAKALLNKAFDVAKEHNIRWIVIETTGAYSAALISRSGFKIFQRIEYKDYKDEEGNVVFQTKYPHIAYSSYVKDLSVEELEIEKGYKSIFI